MMKKLSLRMRLTLLSALVMASVAVILTSMFLFGADRIFVRDLEQDRKSTRLNSSHSQQSRMPSSA